MVGHKNLFLIVLCFPFYSVFCQSTTTEVLDRIENRAYFYPDLAEKELDAFIAHYDIEDSEKDISKTIYLKAFLRYQKGDIDSSLIFIRKLMPDLISNGDKAGQAKCHLLLGLIAERDGYWQQAKINYYKCQRLLVGNNSMVSGLSNIGIARCDKYNKKENAELLELGVAQLKKGGDAPNKLYADYSNIVLRAKPGLSNVDELEEIASKYLDLKLNVKAASVYKSIAYIYMQNKQLDSALVFVDKAIHFAEDKYPGTALKPGLLQFKAALQYSKKDYEATQITLDKALIKYESYGLKERSYYVYKLQCRLDTINNDFVSAFYHLSQASRYKTVMQSKEDKRMAYLLEITSETDIIKENNLMLQRQRSVLIFSSVIIILLMSFSTYYIVIRYRQRQKRIRNKNRELQNLIVGMNEKLLIQKKLGVDIKPLVDENNTGKNLSHNFEICYLETIDIFINEYPVLSKTEVRYALMFALALSNETICSIQNIQVASVRKARQRIKEKLKLDPEVKLEDYFKLTFDKANATL